MPAFVPPYATVPVLGGRLALGTWQSICLVDLNVDNDERTVRFSFLGRMIRAYRPEDEATVRAVVTAAFGDEGATVAALVDELRVRHARAELVAQPEGAGRRGGRARAAEPVLGRRPAGAGRGAGAQPALGGSGPPGQGSGHRARGRSDRARRGGWGSRRCSSRGVRPTTRAGVRAGDARGFTRPSTRIPEPAFQVAVLDRPRGVDDRSAGLLRAVLDPRLRRAPRSGAGSDRTDVRILTYDGRHGQPCRAARLATRGATARRARLGAHGRQLAARPLPAGVPQLPGAAPPRRACSRGSRCSTSRAARPRSSAA